MAGSYNHIHGNGSGLSMIENMGDAAECIEELYFLLQALCAKDQIEEALLYFNRCQRGDLNPHDAVGREQFFGPAYVRTKHMMQN